MDYGLIFSILAIVLLYFAYQYLVQLESCLCAQASADGSSKADLQMLKYVELFLIVIMVLGILGLYSKVLRSSALVAMLMGIAIVAVYIIVMIHVYRLYNNMPADCECAIKWPRYVLYVQWVSYTLAIFSFVISFVIGFYRGFSTAYEKGMTASEEGAKVTRRRRRRRAGRR
jgi:hypothetical protein